MPTPDLITGLPGELLVRRGLADCGVGHRTPAACLVAIGAPRLRRAGLWPANAAAPPREPERELYRLLRQQGGDAYSRYRALLRELACFEQALDHRCRLNLQPAT